MAVQKRYPVRNTVRTELNEVFPDIRILQTLSAKLSWSHFVKLIMIDEPLKRQFYVHLAITDQWSVRTLSERIDSQLFERTAISKKPDVTLNHDLKKLKDTGEVSQSMVLKDPYVLDFLDLNDSYVEKDLEDAILRELQQFLLELGSGFSFIARQFRMQIDDDDFYIDLLLYNRKLKRLVAIDLKVGALKPSTKAKWNCIYVG